MKLSLEGALGKLKDSSGPALICGLTQPVKALIVSTVARRLKRPVLLVEAKEARAEDFLDTLRFFQGDGQGPRLLRFPAWETLPYDDLSPHPATTGMRLAAMNALAHGERDFIMTTSSEALARLAPSPQLIKKSAITIKPGAAVSLERLTASLVMAGYRRVDLTEEMGEFSIRGGIADIFTGVGEQPYRVELFGDEVESIRYFDPSTQISTGKADEALILPFREVFYQPRTDPAGALESLMEETGAAGKEAGRILELIKTKSFFNGMESYAPLFFGGLSPLLDILPPETLVILDEEEDIIEHLNTFYSLMEEEYETRLSMEDPPPMPAPDKLFTGKDALLEELDTRAGIHLRELALDEADGITIQTSPPVKYLGDQERFFKDLDAMMRGGFSVILACATKGSAERFLDILGEKDIGARLVAGEERMELFRSLTDPQASLFESRLFLMEGALPQGFVIHSGKWAVITEDEVFGKARKAKRRRTSQARAFKATLEDLKPGDLVTHKVHGVGRYHGTREMMVSETMDEYLEIEYAENQRLYLPIHSIEVVDKYMGAGGAAAGLDRMGGVTWKKTKARVKKNLLEMANELLRIHAARELSKGKGYSAEGQFHKEFADTFEFVETEDQLAAIEDVAADMELERPMDRLVCGDVGYGKTEVALRAAFKAAYDGSQVAVLAPTTLLTQQHFQTFSERLKAFPVTVESLSRFKTKKEQSQVLERLMNGGVDIVIGTHRLLQKDVKFQNLGLVIVDEEQRFGVRHKERLKTIRSGVDTLSLTATPIPRTLHTSLLGIKDLSVIETPPVDRQAIRSMIVKFSEMGIRDAVMRELDRGGQVFFVHNKVKSIHAMARFLERVVPEARTQVAHGQMNEKALEKVMLDFLDHKFDILLCTTIIESGLDIPSANTILINRADQFGLSQLYQLRGRVGRDRAQAYCYFIAPQISRIKPVARKRLKAVEELTELGSGFKLAARDMEIRGVGNLLGAEQSGQIDAVGFEEYRRMVEDTIRELKGEPPREDFDVNLSLGFFGRIPVEYVPGVNQRMEVYGKINGAQDPETLRQVEAEIRDRFGPPPEETRKLLLFARIKVLCRALKIEKVDLARDRLYLSFSPSTPLAPGALVTAAYEGGKSIRFISENTVEFKVAGEGWKRRADNILEFMLFLKQSL